MLTTIEMLKKIEGHPDCQDCVTGGQYFTRSYWLACDDEMVWGADPDGHEIEMTRIDVHVIDIYLYIFSLDIFYL